MAENRTALLINPPLYDTQYWERWSLPHGLLKVATFLKNSSYQTRLIDCMAVDDKHQIPVRKTCIVNIETRKRYKPETWSRPLQPGEKVRYVFGKNISDIEQALEPDLFTTSPDEIWITSIMSYWWESTRDVIQVCKRYFPKAKVRVGGIYPTLAPEHAREMLGLDDPVVIEGWQLDVNNSTQRNRDLVVKGEIHAANDLDLDFSLYNDGQYCRPKYTILTTSRGCPRDCEYCAAYILSGRKVRVRDPDLTLREIRNKYAQGIREFCFYEDNLLMGRKNFLEVLQRIIDDKKSLEGIELHSPEGLEIRLVDVETLKLMKEAGFKRVYLPLETINYDSIAQWKRDFYNLKDFERAVKACEEAGFGQGTQEINVFVLFGLPGEDLQHVYDTAVYASNRTGSIIPMLFAPVPGTPFFKRFEDYFAEMGQFAPASGN